jgi:hypothetical protein
LESRSSRFVDHFNKVSLVNLFSSKLVGCFSKGSKVSLVNLFSSKLVDGFNEGNKVNLFKNGNKLLDCFNKFFQLDDLNHFGCIDGFIISFGFVVGFGFVIGFIGLVDDLIDGLKGFVVGFGVVVGFVGLIDGLVGFGFVVGFVGLVDGLIEVSLMVLLALASALSLASLVLLMVS